LHQRGGGGDQKKRKYHAGKYERGEEKGEKGDGKEALKRKMKAYDEELRARRGYKGAKGLLIRGCSAVTELSADGRNQDNGRM